KCTEYLNTINVKQYTNIYIVLNIQSQNKYSACLYHQVGPKDRIFCRYATQVGSYVINSSNPNFPITQHIQDYNVAFQYLHIFTPTVLNEFRSGFNKVNSDQLNPRTHTDCNPDSLGIAQFRVSTDTTRKFR